MAGFLSVSQPMHTGERSAIVIGGSIGGLVAARVLADHFDRVTVVERDQLPDEPVQRAGVPQARHAHVLLARGLQILEQLFPGLESELEAAGGERFSWTEEAGMYLGDGWAPAIPSDFYAFAASRNLLETVIRRCLRRNDRVDFLAGREVTDLLADAGNRRVTGIRVRVRGDRETAAEELSAELVVDAGGRSSRAPQWLLALGYERVEETVIDAHQGYASRVYRLRSDAAGAIHGAWRGLATMPEAPKHARSVVIMPMEHRQWVVTLAGINGDYPPTGEAEFLEFARSLSEPFIYNLIKDGEPLSPIVGYRRMENRLRHFERMRRWPEQFVVLGDAACAFNPAYAQGMTSAAMSAMVLDGCLRDRGPSAGFAHRFQRALAKSNKTQWLMATGADLAWPNAEGGLPGRVDRLMQRYLVHVLSLSTVDAEAYLSFLEVMHLLSPPAKLFHPRMVVKVIKHALRARRTVPTAAAQPGLPA